MFVVAIGASLATGTGFSAFGKASASLQQKIRSALFRAMLRQDGKLMALESLLKAYSL